MIYSSNSHYCYGELIPTLEERVSMYFNEYQYAEGNIETREERVNTLEFFREYVQNEKYKKVHDSELLGTKETYIPSDFLQSLIPFFFTLNFIFWKRVNNVIIGEPRKFIKSAQDLDYYIKIELTVGGKAFITKIPFMDQSGSIHFGGKVGWKQPNNFENIFFLQFVIFNHLES